MNKLTENGVILGSCDLVIPAMDDGSVHLVVTSPPYAQQRKRQYSSVAEADYPAWTVLINIRPHVKQGQISDYVLRTRLAIREVGFLEIDELIWSIPDKPPLGRIDRPRRAYESVHWFSLTPKPYSDLRACSTGQAGYATGRNRVKADWVHGGQTFDWHGKSKKPRVTDVIRVATGSIDDGIAHPAMFPRGLPRFLIRTFSRPGDLVLDPFVGSGTTVLVAEEEGRRGVGIDSKEGYAELARRRLADQRAARRPAA